MHIGQITRSTEWDNIVLKITQDIAVDFEAGNAAIGKHVEPNMGHGRFVLNQPRWDGQVMQTLAFVAGPQFRGRNQYFGRIIGQNIIDGGIFSRSTGRALNADSVACHTVRHARQIKVRTPCRNGQFFLGRSVRAGNIRWRNVISYDRHNGRMVSGKMTGIHDNAADDPVNAQFQQTKIVAFQPAATGFPAVHDFALGTVGRGIKDGSAAQQQAIGRGKPFVRRKNDFTGIGTR